MLGWFTWLQSALEEGQAEIDDGDEDDEVVCAMIKFTSWL